MILIVEDNPQFAAVIERALTRAGYATVVVGSAEEAMKEIVKPECDIAFIDVALPGMDGVQLARRARETGSTASLIGMSGAIPVIRPESLGMFDQLMTKPFGMADLIQVTRSTLALRPFPAPPQAQHGRFLGPVARTWRLIELFLGHGRALETALTLVKLQYAALLISTPVFVISFADMAISSSALAIPFLLAALSSAAGLYLNWGGYEISRYFRIVGAGLGMTIWFYFLSKNALIGFWASDVTPWCVMAILADVWIIHRGALGLPRPGTLEAV